MADTLLVNGIVTRVHGGPSVRILTDRGFVITIDTHFGITAGNTRTVVSPTGAGTFVVDNLDLVGARITRADYDDHAALRIVLDDNRTLDVPADNDTESWQALNPTGALTAALPGGQVVVWN